MTTYQLDLRIKIIEKRIEVLNKLIGDLLDLTRDDKIERDFACAKFEKLSNDSAFIGIDVNSE